MKKAIINSDIFRRKGGALEVFKLLIFVKSSLCAHTKYKAWQSF